MQTKNIPKKDRRGICNSREMQYDLEQHNVAGRKHDCRVVTVCRRCHAELPESQNTWDVRWLEKNQSEHVRNEFFLMGLHDILILRLRFAANEMCHNLDVPFRQKIFDLLQIRQEIYA